MNNHIKILILVAISGLILGPALAIQAAQPPAVAAQAGPDAISSAIQAMQQAKDPSAVVDAFAGAQEANKNSVPLYEAYVRRMAEFGMAELVRAQAQRLTELDPANALGWGMLAYLHATKGEMDKAVATIILATRKPTDDPFVLSVAGQLLAWFDQKPLRNDFDQATRKAMEQMRKDLAEKEAFAEGYTQASQAYQAMAKQGQPPQEAAAGNPGGGGTVFAEPAPDNSPPPPPSEAVVEQQPPQVVYQPYPVYEPAPALLIEPPYYDDVILFTPFYYYNYHRHFGDNRFWPTRGLRGDRVGDRDGARRGAGGNAPVRLSNGTTVSPLDLRNTGLSLQAATGQPNMLNTGLGDMRNRGQPDMRNRLGIGQNPISAGAASTISGRSPATSGPLTGENGRIYSTTPRTPLGMPRIDSTGRGIAPGSSIIRSTNPPAGAGGRTGPNMTPRFFNPAFEGTVRTTTPRVDIAPKIIYSGPGTDGRARIYRPSDNVGRSYAPPAGRGGGSSGSRSNATPSPVPSESPVQIYRSAPTYRTFSIPTFRTAATPSPVPRFSPSSTSFRSSPSFGGFSHYTPSFGGGHSFGGGSFGSGHSFGGHGGGRR